VGLENPEGQGREEANLRVRARRGVPGWRFLGRRGRVGLVAVVVLGAVGAAIGVARAEDEASGTDTQLTATAMVSEVTRNVSVTGTVEPAQQESVSFDTSGTVIRVLVSLGSQVKKGDPLAAVNGSVADAQLDAARAAVNAALDELSDSQDGGDSLEIAAAQAQLVTSRDDLRAAQESVDATVLRAPFAGQVVAVDLEVGDVVGGSGMTATEETDTSSSSTGTVEIASTRRFVAETTVGSTDLDSMAKGLQAELTATGLDETLYATVTEISSVATTTSTGAAAFPVTLSITGSHKGLYGGTSVSAQIVVEKRQGVLNVASRALGSDDEGTYVMLVGTDGETTRQPVEVGETYGEVTEILSGLEQGDEVELAGPVRGGGGQDGAPGGGFPGGEMGDMGGGMPGGMLPGAPQ
jgi:multidrug efflux pump subunit AcrA (membrane-fusion protein)